MADRPPKDDGRCHLCIKNKLAGDHKPLSIDCTTLAKLIAKERKKTANITDV